MEVFRRGLADVPLRGSWFIEAFEGPDVEPAALRRRRRPALVGSVDDAIKTMAVVEACYESSAHGGMPIPFELS